MEDYVAKILRLRQANQLHSFVEERLIEACKDLFPELHPIKEVQGLAGGRNDLMLFQFNAHKILFEIFGTASQVSRDLRILDKTQADIKIAIIIDKEVDPKVFERFLRENPEGNYPFVFIGEIVDPSRAHEGRLKLYELITRAEASRFARFMRHMTATAFRRFLDECRRDAILVFTEDDLREGTATFEKVFVTMIVRRLHEFGVDLAALKRLAQWMSKPGAIDFALQKVSLGFNMFLYTDLRSTFAFFSDIELLDFLDIGPKLETVRTLLSINSIVIEILDKYYEAPDFHVHRQPRISVGRSTVYKNPDGRLVTFSVPLEANKIIIFPPTAINGTQGLTTQDIIQSLEISVPDGPVRVQAAPSPDIEKSSSIT